MPKITPAQRKMLINLFKDDKRAAQRLALNLGLSYSYVWVLYQRSHHPIPSRKPPNWMLKQQQEERHGETEQQELPVSGGG